METLIENLLEKWINDNRDCEDANPMDNVNVSEIRDVRTKEWWNAHDVRVQVGDFLLQEETQDDVYCEIVRIVDGVVKQIWSNG